MAKRAVTITMSELPPRLHRPRDEDYERIYGGMIMGCVEAGGSCMNYETCCAPYECWGMMTGHLVCGG